MQHQKIVKVTIISTLGYLISLVDLLPDVMPGGTIEDVMAIMLILKMFKVYATDELKAKTAKRVSRYGNPLKGSIKVLLRI